MEDGSIVINTELDTSGFAQGSNQLIDAIRSLIDKFRTFKETVSQLMGEVSRNGIDPQGATEAMNLVEAQWEKGLAEMGKIYEEFKAKAESGEINKEQFEQYVPTLQELEQTANEAKDSVDQLNDALSGGGTSPAPKGDGKGFFESYTSAMKKFIKGIGTAIGGIRTMFGRMFSGGGGGRSKNTLTKGLLKPLTSVGMIIKREIVKNFMRFITQGVREGMRNLAGYSKQVEANLTTLKSALGQLKNSLATAFAPILSVVTPILATLINYLSQAVTMIAQFFSALGGSTTFVRAKSYTDAYTKSVGGASKATKELERQLAGFDELEVLNRGSGGSGGGGGGGVSPADMFETVNIAPNIVTWVESLKEAFDRGDFEGVGEIIAQKINESIAKARELINPDVIQPKIDGFITKFGTIFNSIITNVDWEGIGGLLGEGVNIAFSTLNTLLTTIDLSAVAEKIAELINGFFTTINWESVGDLLATGINVAFKSLYKYLNTLKPKNITKGLWTAINKAIDGVDWQGVGKAIGEVINKGWELLDGLISGFEPEKVTDALRETLVGAISNINFVELGFSISKLLEKGIDLAGSLFKTRGKDGGMGIGDLVEKIVKGIGDFFTGMDVEGLVDSIAIFCMRVVASLPDILLGLIKGLFSVISGKVKTMIHDSFLANASEDEIAKFDKWFDAKAQGFYGTLDKWQDEYGKLIDGAIEDYKKSVSKGGTDVDTKTTSIAKTVISNMTITSSLKTAGLNAMLGFIQGMESSDVTKKAGQLADKISGKVKKKFGINSPSRVFRDEIGRWIPLGLMEGIEDTTPNALKTMDNLADAVANEINHQTYSAQILPEAQMDGFADTIVNGFIALGDKLQAIAERVAYMMPGVANGLMPYGTGAYSSATNNDYEMQRFLSGALVNATNQIVNAINNNGNTTVTVDGNAISETVIDNINRRARQLNASPLVI